LSLTLAFYFHPLYSVVDRLSATAEFQMCAASAADYLQRDVLMTTTVQVRQRGTVTIPAEMCQKYGIEPGDTFRVIDLDGMFVLTPMVPMVPELAREIEKIRLQTGLDTVELLQSLRKDLSILVAALQADCPWLLTFNTRHFQPGHLDVELLPPGKFVQRVRRLLTQLP
jgi:bifunctional DNA-binding transcriptional regulator/antitoxin component of YhaV-PrlF toxin-antitoxin module